ncbi:MAG: hypothetical protein DRN15_05690, partial [Thermoprotei archaeon]
MVVDLTKEIAELAGEIDVKRKRRVKGCGMADSIILATARIAEARVVAGDDHSR